MTELTFAKQIGVIKTELQKPDIDTVRSVELSGLLEQYLGAAQASLSTHTARMINPDLARKTSTDYLTDLESWFLDLFPPEESA